MVISVYYMTHVGGSRPRTPGVEARKSKKIEKIIKNCQFYGCHGNKICFFQKISFDHDRASPYGHFGVLHDLLYPSNNVWDFKNLQK